jgi:L-amino acid N-acyltransferase YncA
MLFMGASGQLICLAMMYVTRKGFEDSPRILVGGNNTRVRSATPDDTAAIAVIYNQGIEDRIATFETRFRSPEDVRAWFDDTYPVLVVEKNREVIAFASSFAYSARECYAGIAECSVYVRRDRRHLGAGRVALQALIDAAETAGIWKLVSRVFIENTASRKLIVSLGFREVGIYEKHGKLDGTWRDVIIVERLIPSNLK